MSCRWCVRVMAVGLVVGLFSGCSRSDGGPRSGSDRIIRIEGSDTMVNLAQAWAEEYHQKHSGIQTMVSGGGSGVGIAALIDGNCDLANSSRKMKDKEIQRAEQKLGKRPVEHIVGYDALAVYVNKNNPLEEITLQDLAEIYGEGGRYTKWSELGATIPGDNDEIIRVSRQNNSGTHAYFREAVLGETREYKQGAYSQSGSKDLVALVSRTPSAIGYSGMGYATPEVKLLKISKKKGEPAVAPTVENALNGSYPITRPLLIYSAGEASGEIQRFLDWIMSPEGQQVIVNLGFVPVEHE